MPDSRLRRSTIVMAALTAIATTNASAQGAIPKSQLATVSQLVAGTRLEILYRRPVARGRPLFGALVSWGKIWTPSADSAARLTVSNAVTVNGATLPAGTYGIWAIPDSTEWTIIFSGAAEAFHLRYPAGRDVLRVKAAPRTGNYVESLQFDFPMVDADSATLHLRWGTTVVPLSIRAPVDGAH